MKDFYYILGLDAPASPEEIREAYRQLSRRFAADADSEDSYLRNHFREISEAFEVLSDATRRTRYDAALKRAGLYPGQAMVPKRSFYQVVKSIDVAFTILLILITVLFGDYVIKSISGAKKARAQTVATVTETADPIVQPIRKKRRKQKLNRPAQAMIVPAKKWLPVKDTTKYVTSPQAKVVTKTLVQPTPVAVIANPPAARTEYLYAAYLRPSKAGNIYLRKDDHYGSSSVSIIPDNAKVLVLAEDDKFYKVNFNNNTGFVLKKSVQPEVIY